MSNVALSRSRAPTGAVGRTEPVRKILVFRWLGPFPTLDQDLWIRTSGPKRQISRLE